MADPAYRKVLVTGAAGFIGAHLTRRLLDEGCEVVGADNLNTYYDPGLKRARLEKLCAGPGFRFVEMDLADRAAVARLFSEGGFGPVVHLAAQAGVRYSLENPHAYTDSNLVAFVNLLEGVRARQCPHFVYASSSSVYGANKKVPFAETDNVDCPVSLYAATKKSNELLAHSYAHLFSLPMTGLRFFTVYGPWGRPDMAIFKFVKAILKDQAIDVYNHGDMRRDFTYIDDIVEGIVRILHRPPAPAAVENVWSTAPYRVCNIGNHRPVELKYMISLLEEGLGRKARMNLLPMQPGDVYETYASIDRLHKETGYEPRIPIEEGVSRFLAWYRDYYRIGS